MKTWHYQAMQEASRITEWGCQATLMEWPELAEALTANRIALPIGTSMRAVREVCRLILSADEVVRLRNRVNELESHLALSIEMRTNCGDL